ncbi:MAG: adenosylhomocysteinase [Epsilonproteobacteria bacterium]|nr:adenosylhomocysteinase [Campylobacterota bacterium]
MNYDIKDVGLAGKGKLMIEWAEMSMPVLKNIKNDFEKRRPLDGVKIGCCLHVTTETAALMRTLKAGGAVVGLAASNPLSTKDYVAAALIEDGIPVFAINGEDRQTYYRHLESILEMRPNITMDDGGDLISLIHSKHQNLTETMLGSTEETTTGVIRLQSMEKDKALKVPVIAVNEAETKHLFDNRYGTGQSTLDGILRATNRLIAGSCFVVSGYGWCGKGMSMRAKGMGAKVIVCEINPVKALEAAMDGFSVMPINEAAAIGDFFVTVTGNINVIDKEAMEKMKNGAMLANSGHFDSEINTKLLKETAVSARNIRPALDEYRMSDGRKIYLLADGRLVNLSSAEGHPSSVMDMSFANQALSAQYLNENKDLEHKVYIVPTEIDNKVASLKLKAMGITIDTLTKEQERYLSSWNIGT